MDFVRAHPEHDDIVVAHYLAIWESYGTPREHLREDAEEIVHEFLKIDRAEQELASFIAFDERAAAASVSCRLMSCSIPRKQASHSTQGWGSNWPLRCA
jgi:hypothetical protein